MRRARDGNDEQGRAAGPWQSGEALRPAQLILRCYAERQGEQWVALCLDLTLAAQAETFDDARAKLEAMIVEYVYDAVAGEDKAHAAELLSRKAPLPYWLKYWYYRARERVGAARHGLWRLFSEPFPLLPQQPRHV